MMPASRAVATAAVREFTPSLGRHITSKSEVSSALGELLDAPTAFLLHVSIDAEENLWPLVPPGASNDQMLENMR